MQDPRRIRLVQVQAWQDLGPHMRRIVFHGAELADYPCRCNGTPFRILLPRNGQKTPALPDSFEGGRPRWRNPEEKPYSRVYTVRDYDAHACTLTVDFVLHGDNGPASAFAHHVAVGQTVGITAPKSSAAMVEAAAHYLLVGDLTALPAIAAILESLADCTATGDVLLLLPDAADLPADVVLPAGFKLQLFAGGLEAHQAVLAAAAQCRPPHADCCAWFAAEATLIADLRRLTRTDWQLPAARCHAVPYWRNGESEETYHVHRHAFVDGNAQ